MTSLSSVPDALALGPIAKISPIVTGYPYSLRSRLPRSQSLARLKI